MYENELNPELNRMAVNMYYMVDENLSLNYHTKEKHFLSSETQLVKRLKTEDKKTVSSFTLNEKTVERLVHHTVKQNILAVLQWLMSDSISDLVLTHVYDKTIGIEIFKSNKAYYKKGTNNLVVVLTKADNTKLGYKLKTTYCNNSLEAC